MRRFLPASRVAIFGWLLAGCAATPHSVETSLAPSAPATTAPFLDGDQSFQFAVMGDRTGGARPGVFNRSVEAVNRLQPDFVMSVGDYIEGYTEDLHKLTSEWDEVDNALANLDMKFFRVVGNHDVSNTAMADLWSQRYGDPYYSFVRKDVLFLALSTEDPFVELPADITARQAAFKEAFAADPEGTQARVLEAVKGRPDPVRLPGSVNISAKQIAFVKDTLAAHRDVRWTMIFMHKPAWAYDSAAFAEIETLLSDRPYTVIAGHEHYYEHDVRNGRDYFTMATCGGVWLKDGPGRLDHTLWITMTDDGPVIANIRIDGISGKSGPR